MSQATPAAQPAGSESSRGAPPSAPSRPPLVRLHTWVNVVLVLTLLASCSAASQAGDAVDRVFYGAGSDGSSIESEVRDMCRLLGAVAAKQGVDLEETFAGGDAETTCQAAARGTGTP